MTVSIPIRNSIPTAQITTPQIAHPIYGLNLVTAFPTGRLSQRLLSYQTAGGMSLR